MQQLIVALWKKLPWINDDFNAARKFFSVLPKKTMLDRFFKKYISYLSTVLQPCHKFSKTSFKYNDINSHSQDLDLMWWLFW